MLNNKKNESIKPTEDMINNDEKISEPKDESVDNSFVIAGNGGQTTIKTTDDTAYNVSDDKVEVNDSVTVFDTESDDTITATDIRVINL